MATAFMSKGDFKRDILQSLSAMADFDEFIATCANAPASDPYLVTIMTASGMTERECRAAAKWYAESTGVDAGGTIIQGIGNLLVALGKLPAEAMTRLYAYVAAQGAATRTPLATRPIVALFDVASGKGVTVANGASVLRFEIAPAINGMHVMSAAEAELLGGYIADKMFVGLQGMVSSSQIIALFSGVKTAQQLVDEEINAS